VSRIPHSLIYGIEDQVRIVITVLSLITVRIDADIEEGFVIPEVDISRNWILNKELSVGPFPIAENTINSR